MIFAQFPASILDYLGAYEEINMSIMYECMALTPLTKLGELGSELVLMSKTEVQVKDEIKTCHFHDGLTKKVQVMSIKSCK